MPAEDEPFTRAIAERPFEAGPRLVYADWLEERGDPRAADVRRKCRHRLPVSPAELRHLAVVAAAREKASAADVVVADATTTDMALVAGPLLRRDLVSSAVRSGLHEDLGRVNRVAVARNFPRDDDGRLSLCATVLLAEYPSLEVKHAVRTFWLVATGPKRRRDPQNISVRLDLIIAENQAHNWSRARWYWDERHAATPELERWGVSVAELSATTGAHPTRAPAEDELIARCTALQDAGRFEDALRLCGVDFSEELSRLLNAEPFLLSGGCDHPDAKAVDARAAKLRRALWESAPWRFAATLSDAQCRLDAWRAEKPGRPVKSPELRLFILPGAPHARKPGPTLTRGPDGRPRLAIHFTAANTLAPETTWKRPQELDIARWCPPAG